MRLLALALAGMASMSHAASVPPLASRHHGGARPLGARDRSLRALRVRGGAAKGGYRTPEEAKSIVLDAVSDEPSGDFRVAVPPKRGAAATVKSLRSKKGEPITLSEASEVLTVLDVQCDELATELVGRQPPAASRSDNAAQHRRVQQYVERETELGRSKTRLLRKLEGAVTASHGKPDELTAALQEAKQAWNDAPHPAAAAAGFAPAALYKPLKRRARVKRAITHEKDHLSGMSRALEQYTRAQDGKERGAALGEVTGGLLGQTAAGFVDGELETCAGPVMAYIIEPMGARLEDLSLEYQTKFHVNQALRKTFGFATQDDAQTQQLKADEYTRKMTLQRNKADLE